MNPNQVRKDLSPEESAIIADIKSLLAQLESAESAEAPEAAAAPEPVEMAAMTDGQPAGSEDQKELEEEKIEKDETATEKADARIDTLPTDDEKALSLIGKAFARLSGNVKKDAQPVDATLLILRRIAKSLDAVSRRQNQTDEAVVGILEGMGVAEQVVAKSAVPAARPVQSGGADAQAFLEALKGLVQKSATAAPETPGTVKDVLLSLAGM
jgi:hypothetical protein